MDRTARLPSAVALALVLTGAGPASAPQDSAAPFLAWARGHVAPLTTVEPGRGTDDLQSLRRLVGDARVVALGEGAHGVHEFLALRNRLFAFLVEELGVTAIATESGYSESVAVDDYVLGRRDLEPAVVGGVFSWSLGAPRAENRELIEWMRAYNARPTTSRKIRFYGVDLTGGRSGRFVRARDALDAALAYLASVDADQAQRLIRRLTPVLGRFSSAAYDSLAAEEKAALTAAIGDLVSLCGRRRAAWVARTSEEAFERACRQAVVARELDDNFHAARSESNPQARREAGMAENLRWVLEREGPESRVFFFAADWHVSKGPMESDRWGRSAGEYLREALGDRFVAIGTAFEEGASGFLGGQGEAAPVPLATADTASVAGALARVGPPLFLLELRDAPRQGPVAEWLGARRGLQAASPRKDLIVAPVAETFDALVFLRRVGPVHALQ